MSESEALTDPVQPDVEPRPTDTAAHRFARRGRGARAYGSVALLVAALVVLVALIVDNTRSVKLSWVFGSGHASLIWIILVAAIVGWLAGIATSILLRRRTRRAL
jgi:uncharacterized integral membrane protein